MSADIFEQQYAAVMGISKDLNLVGNNFSNVAFAFFIAYLIAEVPNGSSLIRISLSYVFSRLTQDTFSKRSLWLNG